MAAIKHDIILHTVASLVAAGGSFTVAYPLGKSAEDYLGGVDHIIVSQSIRPLNAPMDFSLAFGASNITVTLATNTALAAGTVIHLHVDRAGGELFEDLVAAGRLMEMEAARMLFGPVATAVANGVCASQALTAAALNALINGSLATANVATFATPRNVVAAWTNTAVLTVTGTDEYGKAIVESSASGVTFTGKKAFKTITRVRVSADVTGLTVGSGNVLGLPIFLADVADVLREAADGVAATAGVVVAGDQTVATALTGDVRGTWAPNAAPNGARIYDLTAVVRSLTYRGRAQFAA